MRDFASCYNEHAVKVSDSSCSGSRSSTSSSTSPIVRDPSVQSTVTCFYATRPSTQKELLLRVTWSKSPIGQGLSVSVDDTPLGRPCKPSAAAAPALPLRKKKGSRSFVSGDTVVGLYWDISSARYDSGPEPVGNFYLVVIADAEFVLLLGDLSRDHVKKFEGAIPVAEFTLVGRREQLVGGGLYSTRARFGDNGGDHEISIRCRGDGRDARDSELLVCVDKKRVVHVRRLRWNFRGNQTIFVDGLPVDMMWDVHDWWFSGGGDTPGCAAFMFRTRSALESRLWLEEELLHREQGKSAGFSLLIHAFKSP